MRVYPGINLSCLHVDGNAAGMRFASTSIFVLIGGLRLKSFLLGSAAGGAAIAWLLMLMRQRPSRQSNHASPQLFVTTPQATDSKTAARRGVPSSSIDALAVAH